MITYEQAVKEAKAVDPKMDTYFEYPDAYVFTNSKAEGDEREDNDVVVLKSSGNLTGYSEYIRKTKYWNKEVQGKLIV